MKEKKALKDKSAVTQWTLDQFVTNSLNPSVADTEAHEYQRYISHPLNLPLVVTADVPPNPNLEFLGYVNSISAKKRYKAYRQWVKGKSLFKQRVDS